MSASCSGSALLAQVDDDIISFCRCVVSDVHRDGQSRPVQATLTIITLD